MVVKRMAIFRIKYSKTASSYELFMGLIRIVIKNNSADSIVIERACQQTAWFFQFLCLCLSLSIPILGAIQTKKNSTCDSMKSLIFSIISRCIYPWKSVHPWFYAFSGYHLLPACRMLMHINERRIMNANVIILFLNNVECSNVYIFSI